MSQDLGECRYNCPSAQTCDFPNCMTGYVEVGEQPQPSLDRKEK